MQICFSNNPNNVRDWPILDITTVTRFEIAVYLYTYDVYGYPHKEPKKEPLPLQCNHLASWPVFFSDIFLVKSYRDENVWFLVRKVNHSIYCVIRFTGAKPFRPNTPVNSAMYIHVTVTRLASSSEDYKKVTSFGVIIHNI